MASRAIIIQRKTKRPVQFEITDQTRTAVGKLIELRRPGPQGYLLFGHSKAESTVQYLGTELYDAQEIAEQTEI